MTTLLNKIEITPFAYQEQALASIENAENAGKKHALVVMASGLGKTVVAAFFAKRHFARNSGVRCLFLCHQNEILEQAQIRFQTILGDNLEYGFYHGYEKSTYAQLLFASFQTMKSSLDKFDPEDFNLIIVDETHHVMAETYKDVLDYFEADFKLGITATPKRSDEQDIREIYDEPVYVLSLPEALARGLLCPVEYKLMTDEISSLKELKTEHGNLSIGRLNRLVFIPKRDEEIARIIQEEMNKIANPRLMTFCSSIEHAERMAEIIPGSVPIHSRVSSSEKRVRLELFRQGSFMGGVTVDMFNEALDIPETNLIVFLRSTKSPTVYFQQLGRGLRPHPSKSKVTILDFAGNCERVSTIYDLWTEVKEKQETLKEEMAWNGEPGLQPFMLNVDTVGFQERVIPLVQFMKRLNDGFYSTWEEASVAATQLKLTTAKGFQKGYKVDYRLPSNPQQIYSNFPGWDTFLGKEETYVTWLEASDATIRLGIKDMKEYKKKYKEDLKLPANPKKYYLDYPGVDIFFQKLYRTQQEASDAAIKLGIQTKAEYHTRRKEDSLLPLYPEQRYADFPGFVKFLGKESAHSHLNNFYPTWQEASDAVEKLGGITSMREYIKQHKEDSRLHVNPHTFYSNYPGRPIFLKLRYATWQEAAEATRKLGITTQNGYRKKYSNDSKLPSYPDDFYPDFPGYQVFFGVPDKEGKYSTWQEAALVAKTLGIKDHKGYLKRYTEDPRLPGNPAAQYSNFPGWYDFFGTQSKFDKYATWQESSQAARSLGFKTKRQYKAKKNGYKIDPKLPRNPERYYLNFPGWVKFLGGELFVV